MTTRHLDLGCGPQPRNPYGADEVVGLDIQPIPATVNGFSVVQANLVLDKIPFEDGHFSSVSAYDFIEHVPRLVTLPGGGTRLPFVELMNEIWRVLRPGGRFYAVTPAWPNAEAFVDPTHVNIITAETHRYFCVPHLGAAVYGFRGRFSVRRVQWIRKRRAYERPEPDMAQRLRTLVDVLKRRRVHLLWELEALESGQQTAAPSTDATSGGR